MQRRDFSVILQSVTLEEFRREKDAFFASSRSPLQGEARAGFRGLRYYPPNPALRFSVPLEVDAERTSLLMDMSTGGQRVYERLGWVTFTVDGEETRLALYAPEGDLEPASGFVPFRDATSGKETYGSGRYLEAEVEHGIVTLDFNFAYNPFCAYGDAWSCPIPPLENWLKVPIRAGELNLEPEEKPHE
jgi:uncharacterized protein